MAQMSRQSSSKSISNSESTTLFSSLVLAACQEGVQDEKCVVAQFRTTIEQRASFAKHLSTCTRDRIAIEWVIDIADETNGWFYGTAYHYDDITQMLHVMVPDKQNPSFDGNVLLDYRSVHLIECVDGRTDALFNKIVRESVVRVKWEVDWFEEDAPGGSFAVGASNQGGKWIQSCARYYLRIANQVLVEDDAISPSTITSKGFVMLTADTNLKLKCCLKGKGQDDFDRLVTDGSVVSTTEVLEGAKRSLLETEKQSLEMSRRSSDIGGNGDREETVSVRKLADMSRRLKGCVSDLLDEREKMTIDRSKMSQMFQSFTINGDLDAGLSLLADAEKVALKDNKKKNIETSDIIYDGDKGDVDGIGIDDAEARAEDTWLLMQKLDKSAVKLLRLGGDSGTRAAGELEFLRRSQRKMKKEIEEKDREIQSLYASRKNSSNRQAI